MTVCLRRCIPDNMNRDKLSRIAESNSQRIGIQYVVTCPPMISFCSCAVLNYADVHWYFGFDSRHFHPCYLVPRFPLPRFQRPQSYGVRRSTPLFYSDLAQMVGNPGKFLQRHMPPSCCFSSPEAESRYYSNCIGNFYSSYATLLT